MMNKKTRRAEMPRTSGWSLGQATAKKPILSQTGEGFCFVPVTFPSPQCNERRVAASPKPSRLAPGKSAMSPKFEESTCRPFAPGVSF